MTSIVRKLLVWRQLIGKTKRDRVPALAGRIVGNTPSVIVADLGGADHQSVLIRWWAFSLEESVCAGRCTGGRKDLAIVRCADFKSLSGLFSGKQPGWGTRSAPKKPYDQVVFSL